MICLAEHNNHTKHQWCNSATIIRCPSSVLASSEPGYTVWWFKSVSLLWNKWLVHNNKSEETQSELICTMQMNQVGTCSPTQKPKKTLRWLPDSGTVWFAWVTTQLYVLVVSRCTDGRVSAYTHTIYSATNVMTATYTYFKLIVKKLHGENHRDWSNTSSVLPQCC